MDYALLVPDITEYVITEFTNHSNWLLAYHNLDHTVEVQQRAIEIGNFYQLPGEDLFILHASSLFHDIGYLFSGATNHEEVGVQKMKEYLDTKAIPEHIITQIEETILFTKRISTPTTVFGKIICDADTYHFGTAEFRHSDFLVKKEIALQTGKEPTNWIANSITLLRDHVFYTDYCQDKLNDGKQKNIHWLESRLKDQNE